MHQGRHYPPVQTPLQGGSVAGSTHGGHKHRQHRHESHKSSQREGHSHKSSKRGGQRREKHPRDSRRSSRRDGSSCQSSESGASSEEEGHVPSSRTSVCSSTDKVLGYFDGLSNQRGNVELPPSPPATIAGDFPPVADDVGSDSGQSEISTGTVIGPRIQRRGYPTRAYREGYTGPPSVASFRTAATSLYEGDDEVSEYGDDSSVGYGAENERPEYGATMRGLVNDSTDDYFDVDAMEKFLAEINRNVAAIKSDVLYTGAKDARIPVWFNTIKLNLKEFQRSFALFEDLFNVGNSTSQQYAPGAVSTPAGAVLQMYEPYTVRDPR